MNTRRAYGDFWLVRQSLNGVPILPGIQCRRCEAVVYDIEPGDRFEWLVAAVVDHVCDTPAP